MSRQNRKTKAIALIVIWSVVSLLVGFSLRFRLLNDIESKTWDWRLRSIAESSAPDPRIKIIMIDQPSLDRMAHELKNYWPWPRSLYNPVLFFLQKGGAQAIGFDMLFTEYNVVSDDLEFAQAVGSTIPVVNSAALLRTRVIEMKDGDAESSQVEYNNKALALLKKRQSDQPAFENLYLSGMTVSTFPSSALPFPELLSSTAAVGTVQEESDEDGIYRRVSPGAYLNDTPMLGLSFAMYNLTHPNDQSLIDLKSYADHNKRYLLRFHGPAQTYPWYSIDAIITSFIQINEGKKPIIDPAEFKDSLVLLGCQAPGLLDLRPSPFPGIYPGVEIHATALDNLLHHDFLREVPFLYSLLAAVFAVGLMVITSLYFFRFQIPLLSLLFGSWVIICFYIGQLGWWIPMVNPLLGMTLATIATVAFQYALEGRQHRFIKNAFQYYVTPDVIDKIVSDPSTLSLGGERRELTIFFSDIQGFTTLSESMEPAKLVQLLNKFLSEMTDIILASGGTIDKYEGDAIIAFWNAPLSIPDHRRRAVEVSLSCQRRLHDLKEYFAKTFGVAVNMRVGLNTGVVTVGNFGSTTRFNYTMIGDAANLASRLEGANKVFGSKILASDITREGATEGIKWRKLGDIRVVGKSNVVGVWEPLDTVVHAHVILALPHYEAGLAKFASGDFAGAAVDFRAVMGDPVSESYLARIERITGQEESKDFSPIWNLTEK